MTLVVLAILTHGIAHGSVGDGSWIKRERESEMLWEQFTGIEDNQIPYPVDVLRTTGPRVLEPDLNVGARFAGDLAEFDFTAVDDEIACTALLLVSFAVSLILPVGSVLFIVHWTVGAPTQL